MSLALLLARLLHFAAASAVLIGAGLAFRPGICLAAPEAAEAELQALAKKVKGFQVIDLTQAEGEVRLAPEQALTIEGLRGVALDENPPRLGARSEPFTKKLGQIAEAGTYVARDIAPFRLRRFDAEYHYDGYGQNHWPMYEYAATHGFNRCGSYTLDPGDWTHLPTGTEWVLLSGYGWGDWFKSRKLDANRWDKLAEAAQAGETLIPAGHFKTKPGYAMIMIDQEFGGLLPEDELRKQPWFPTTAPAAEREKFEDRYYAGYSVALSEPGKAARRDGWGRASIYAWQSFKYSWYGLDPRIKIDLVQDRWRRFMDGIYDAYDVLHVDGYCDAWSAGNVAYTLAAADDAVAFARSHKTVKPVRLYLSTVMLASPGVGPWLRIQPLTNEEVRAMFALQFFTGVDGVVEWVWCERANHQLPPELLVPEDKKKDVWTPQAVQVAKDFAANREGASTPETFHRYDFLRVLPEGDVKTGVVRFQRVDPTLPQEKQPKDLAGVYVAERKALTANLRAACEPVGAMVEGLALVKPLEYILSHGQAIIDAPARGQYRDKSPIVRRVKLNDVQVIATYDPAVVFGGKPREIVLKDFDGPKGLTLRLPADAQVRLFVVRTAPNAARRP